jgi:hypothetical protein
VSVVSFTEAYARRHGDQPQVLVTKKQLAAMYGYGTRWVDLRLAEGAPASTDRRGRRLFDPQEFDAWLKARAA